MRSFIFLKRGLDNSSIDLLNISSITMPFDSNKNFSSEYSYFKERASQMNWNGIQNLPTSIKGATGIFIVVDPGSL